MEKVHGVLAMTLLEKLQFWVLKIVHHLTLIIKNLLVLGNGVTDGINDSTGAALKKLVLTLVKQSQNFASV